MAAVIEAQGRRFHTPTFGLALSEDTSERLVLAQIVSPTPFIEHQDAIYYPVEPGTVDLSLVRSGRAPLLLEHCRHLDSVVGMLIDAWVENGALWCLARVARNEDGERIWGLLQDGFQLSLSLGGVTQGLTEVGPGKYRVQCWRLEEASVVLWGQSPDAHLRLPKGNDPPAQIVARLNAGLDPAKLEVRNRLHLDRWMRWAISAAPKLAEELGVDRDRFCAAMDREVMAQIEELQRSLALPQLRATVGLVEDAA